MNGRTLVDGLRTGALLAVGYITQAIGLTTTSAPRSAFLTGTTLVLVPAAAFAVLRSKLRRAEAIGIALAFAGLLSFYADAGLTVRAGDLWTLTCALAFAFQIVTTNVAARRGDASALAVTQSVIAALAGWTLVLARHGGLSLPLRAVPWPVILYLAVVPTAFVLVLQTWALGRTRPVRAGVIYTMEPVFAALFAWAFFREGMSAREGIGSAAILAGVLVAELWRPERGREG